MTTWIAFLRAVNVSGVNRLPMAEFRDILGAMKPGGKALDGVKTYIQSGNVVFRSDQGGSVLAQAIADAVLARFGFRPPVLMRTLAEIEAALAGNPFAQEEGNKVHFFFMERDLPRATGDFLASVATPSERHAFRGKLLWLHLPDGIGRSKLAQRVGALPIEMTARNMRTVEAVAALGRTLEAA
ncbi:MAG: DUF1697 domain-containing protein [Paracoccaceae bacterium]